MLTRYSMDHFEPSAQKFGIILSMLCAFGLLLIIGTFLEMLSIARSTAGITALYSRGVTRPFVQSWRNLHQIQPRRFPIPTLAYQSGPAQDALSHGLHTSGSAAPSLSQLVPLRSKAENVLLVRHTVGVHNVFRKFPTCLQEWSSNPWILLDPPITEEGKRLAMQASGPIRAAFPGGRPNHLFASYLARAVGTAGLVFPEQSITVVDHIGERRSSDPRNRPSPLDIWQKYALTHTTDVCNGGPPGVPVFTEDYYDQYVERYDGRTPQEPSLEKFLSMLNEMMRSASPADAKWKDLWQGNFAVVTHSDFLLELFDRKFQNTQAVSVELPLIADAHDGSLYFDLRRLGSINITNDLFWTG